MDVGAKFCAVHYLRDRGVPYTHLLALHSKTDRKARRAYTQPLVRVRPPLRPGACYLSRALRRAPGHKFKAYVDWDRDAQYVRELQGYLGLHTDSREFVEGNVGIVTRALAERLYGDPILFAALNTPISFDYNWVRLFYRIPHTDIKQVYRHWAARRLCPNNLPRRYTQPQSKQLRDGMVEHAFERLTLTLARRCGEVEWV